ncbi:MAG: radical SAM protein [Myxococcota bacterium]|nr:radical SAM protein [Myxococcota bacterium]
MGKGHDQHAVIRSRLRSERGNEFVQGGAPVALLYPSPYRAGMSSVGFQWVLKLLRDAGFQAERAFLPDDVAAWKRSRVPLQTYETERPLSHFPVIGISLAYELELAGLIEALEMAGIPPLRSDRTDRHPRIIMGGPLTFSNPLPAAPFVDAMIVGEADDVVVDAFEAASHIPGDAWLDAIAELDGGYVPDLHGETLPAVAKASDERLPAYAPILAPDAELSDMFLIEGERGCHRTCTFCVMRRSTNGGMRLVTPERVLSFVPDMAKRVGLVGAAISDHPHLVGLLEEIVGSGRGVGISSLRADRVARKPDIARLLREGGYKTLTVASDAASERLRRDISKGTKENQLVACAKLAAEHRYKVMKVYMMVGVPGETEDDIEELIRFSKDLASIVPISLGVAPFVPKRNTPLDVAEYAGVKTVDRRLKQLTRGLKGAAEVRPTSARWAWVETELAQGGWSAGQAVYDAVTRGGRFADYRRALQDVDDATRAPWRRVG